MGSYFIAALLKISFGKQKMTNIFADKSAIRMLNEIIDQTVVITFVIGDRKPNTMGEKRAILLFSFQLISHITRSLVCTVCNAGKISAI